jgi:hypothetical protein
MRRLFIIIFFLRICNIIFNELIIFKRTTRCFFNKIVFSSYFLNSNLSTMDHGREERDELGSP